MCRRYLAGISILFHKQLLLLRPSCRSQLFQHMMSSKSAQDEHTTESSAGGEDSSRLWYDASITHLSQLTPTVTGVTINVNMDCPMLTSDQGVTWQSVQPSKPFNFLPGQWVDFYIPAINKVGGYSITSLPSHLPRLELAVKSSRHPSGRMGNVQRKSWGCRESQGWWRVCVFDCAKRFQSLALHSWRCWDQSTLWDVAPITF